MRQVEKAIAALDVAARVRAGKKAMIEVLRQEYARRFEREG